METTITYDTVKALVANPPSIGDRPIFSIYAPSNGFHPVWITVRHFHVGLVLSRVVPILLRTFRAGRASFFAKPLFIVFFVMSRDILKKKTDRPFFLRARLRVASNLYEYATNNCNICCFAVAPTLRANQPEFKDQRARLNRFHT